MDSIEAIPEAVIDGTLEAGIIAELHGGQDLSVPNLPPVHVEPMFGAHPVDNTPEIEGHQIFLSNASPSRRDRVLATAVAMFSLLAFAAIAPFARVQLPVVPAFVPAYESALLINDLITAILLFGQFGILRSRALLVLASGYLFSAMMAVPHALTFPGVFAAGGLLGAGTQTTAWLYISWHIVFPLVMIAYALLKPRRSLVAPTASVHTAIVATVLVVLGAVTGLTLLAILAEPVLPAILIGLHYTPTAKFSLVTVGAVSLFSLVVLWLRRPHTVLDLWLLVVMCAWMFDVALSAFLNNGRYDLGFYAGRIYVLLGASFVLVVMLVETTRLYSRLAVAARRLSEYAGTLETRVRERTTELQSANEALKSEVIERKQAERQLALEHADLELSNQRLRDAQETLSDALESISEAFVIYDRDERFVMCNQAYRNLYADHPEWLKPGESFERLARESTKSGLYPAAIGREDEWVAERLESHRNPSGPIEHPLAGGRCLLVTERRMRNGGTAGLRIDITKLKEIEAQLRETMEHLDRVQRIAGIGSLVIDIASARVSWSGGAGMIFGVDIATVEPTAEYVLSFIHPDDRAAVWAAAEESRLFGVAALPLEYRIIRRDGAERIVYRENDVLRDQNGRPIRRIVTFKDITDLKATEAQLRQTKEHLARALRISGVGTMQRDLRTRQATCSEEFCQILGVDHDSFRPSLADVLNFVHPDDRAMVETAVDKADRAGTAMVPLEFRIIRPDGEVRTVYRESDVECDSAGRAICRILTFKDITDLKATEMRLRETMDNLDRAQRLAHTGSDSRDLITDQAEWSDESYRIFGVDRNNFVPSTENFLGMVIPEDRPRILASRDEIARGRPPAPFEYRIRRPSGEIRCIHRITELIRDPNGVVVRMVGTLRDVTELREAEHRHKELERQLLHSQKLEALGTLAGGVAHDLNNTLTPILVLSKLVLDDLPGDDPMREEIEMIRSAGERARDLVKQILAFSRKQEIQKDEVDAALVVVHAVRMMRATLPPNVAIVEEIGQVPLIHADAGQLQQIVVNLVTNAAHAIGDAEGSVTVRVSVLDSAGGTGDLVQIRIADTGCGMEQEVIDRIFEPFFTTKGVGEGTGLGLAVVHGIVTGHGGTIDVTSQPGEGTTFIILLPISEPANLPLEAAA